MKQIMKLATAIFLLFTFPVLFSASADEAPELQIEKTLNIQTSINQISRELDILRTESKFGQKRIEDASFAVDRMTLLIGVIGIIVAIVGIGIPVFVGFRIHKEAGEYARSAINNAVRKAISEIELTLTDSISKLSQAGQEELSKLTKLREAGEKELDKLRSTAEDSSQTPADLDESSKEAIGDSANGALVSLTPTKGYDEWRSLLTAASEKKDHVKVIEICGRAIEAATNDTESAAAQYHRAYALSEIGQYEQAEEQYKQITQLFKEGLPDELNVLIGKSFINRAVIIEKSGDIDTAIQLLVTATDCYSEISHTRELREVTTLAWSNLSILYLKNEQEELADKAFDYLFSHYSPSESEFIELQLIKARVRKGRILREKEKYIESIAHFQIAIELAKVGDAPAWIEQYSLALLFKIFSLDDIQQYEALVLCADEMQDLLEANSDDEKILGRISTALYYKGRAYDKMGEVDKEIETYDSMFEMFKDFNIPDVNRNVAGALQMKMYTLSIQHKQDEALRVANMLIERYRKSKDKRIKSIVKSAKEHIAAERDSVTTPAAGSPDPS